MPATVSTTNAYLVDAIAGAMRDSLDCAFETFIHDMIDHDSINEHVAKICAERIQKLDEHIATEVEKALDRALKQRAFSRRMWSFLTQKVC